MNEDPFVPFNEALTEIDRARDASLRIIEAGEPDSFDLYASRLRAAATLADEAARLRRRELVAEQMADRLDAVQDRSPKAQHRLARTRQGLG